MNSNTVKVIKVSEWEQHREGYNPARVVLWERTERIPELIYDGPRFVTHIEYALTDAGISTGKLSFSYGHYDMSLKAAERDFESRCRQYNLKPAAEADPTRNIVHIHTTAKECNALILMTADVLEELKKAGKQYEGDFIRVSNLLSKLKTALG